jgi:nodulation protein E
MRRVAITGAGTVNPLAQDVPGTYLAFREGRSAIGALSLRDVERLSVRIGAQVKDWVPEAHFDRTRLSAMDRFAQFAVVAAREAVARSRLELSTPLRMRAGVILGTAGGGMTTSDDSYRAVYEEGKNRVHPLVVPRLMHNAAAAHVSLEFGLAGPGFSVSSACASSNHAMALAFQMVRSGAAPVMLAGGSEAMLCFGGIKAWEGLRVMSSEACRPFSRNRSGMVQGEGAAVFVFEDMDHAITRGAPILAELAGCGVTMDAADLVAPSQEGAARAMLAALEDAGLGPREIGYINAHGTGTTANDRTECAAILDVFGEGAMNIPVSSTKSMHGHLIGGTGAVELLACLMALREGIIAPTVGYQEPDPDCPLDVVPNHFRRATVRACLSNAFAFGGMNAVLALRKG